MKKDTGEKWFTKKEKRQSWQVSNFSTSTPFFLLPKQGLSIYKVMPKRVLPQLGNTSNIQKTQKKDIKIDKQDLLHHFLP